MNDQDLVCQLTGWRQTTAEILYRMPDHPGLVQTFLWQDLVHRFLDSVPI
jgi:uncharacterized protein Usg